MATPTPPVKVVAIVQEHRGHGVTTAAYFMARVLGSQHIPVLIADLTDRPARLRELAGRMKAPLVAPWHAPSAWLRSMPALLAKLREEIQGKVRCVLLDADVGIVEQLNGARVGQGVDYVLIATEASTEGQQAADHIAERFPALRDRQRIGICFVRIDPKDADVLPSETPDGLPVLGFWPADYRLANTAEDYGGMGLGAGEPLAAYQAGITRLTMRLSRLVGIR